ncbi:hypothetical protein QBZ16_005263 [Prototheca wickerhamii]|uniref:BPL/LPL catalytic domain-containing protein n=1 Tax=Prototheca wickerhamii TaxID=3111 RepID=A0AAD9IGZ6_PROWI|nr:hypothetical protein QBZ16_005263 [Prototheca wickerhamii]
MDPGNVIRVQLKWPNDIYANGLKIGGILCHSTYRDRAFQLVWGLGLNVANAQPTTSLVALIGEEARRLQIDALAPRRETLLAQLLNWLEPAVARLAVDGFDPFRPAYLGAWLHTDQRVELEEGGEKVPVIVRGLTDDGYLLAQDAGGAQRYELHPDGNSLDFFKGLVRKKLPV